MHLQPVGYRVSRNRLRAGAGWPKCVTQLMLMEALKPGHTGTGMDGDSIEYRFDNQEGDSCATYCSENYSNLVFNFSSWE